MMTAVMKLKDAYSLEEKLYQEKEMQKGKWLSEEALQIAVKREKLKAKDKRKDIPI